MSGERLHVADYAEFKEKLLQALGEMQAEEWTGSKEDQKLHQDGIAQLEAYLKK